jgi:hypothetical protein
MKISYEFIQKLYAGLLLALVVSSRSLSGIRDNKPTNQCKTDINGHYGLYQFQNHTSPDGELYIDQRDGKLKHQDIIRSLLVIDKDFIVHNLDLVINTNEFATLRKCLPRYEIVFIWSEDTEKIRSGLELKHRKLVQDGKESQKLNIVLVNNENYAEISKIINNLGDSDKVNMNNLRFPVRLVVENDNIISAENTKYYQLSNLKKTENVQQFPHSRFHNGKHDGKFHTNEDQLEESSVMTKYNVDVKNRFQALVNRKKDSSNRSL